MPLVLELRPVANGGDDRSGGLRANALDRCDTLTILVLTEDAIDRLIEQADPAVEIAENLKGKILKYWQPTARSR